MAVGDPSQAIYTWRGASAGTMASFHKYFPKAHNQTGTEQFSLPTTFRNDKIILAAANTISAQIKAAGGQQVVELEARDNAGPGELAYGIYETVETESQAIAEYFKALWNPDAGKSFAVLVRKRSQITSIENALREQGLPVEVIGIGGLIHIPEVADVVATRFGGGENLNNYLPSLIVSVLLILSVIFTPNGPGEKLRGHHHKKKK
jgi:DNA helicase-2/ATP-dependent DNA helicase PcrA